MEQRLSLVTLGVADLDRSVGFYEQLGWTAGNDWRAQGVAFFQLPGLVFALWSREELAADSGTSVVAPGAIVLAHNVGSPALVDALLDAAAAAGATIHRRGAPTEWGGYSGVLHDPDGHPWEVAHNPHWTIGDDGATRL